MIVFCHLLNDRSGSPTVLRSTIAALAPDHAAQLYIGSQGRGVLEDTGVPLRRYWYRRSQHRLVTMVTFFASQIALYRALLRARDIPADATVFVNTLLPIGAMLWGRRSGRRVIVHVHEVSITPAPLRRVLLRCAAGAADRLLYVSGDHLARLPIAGPPAEILPNPIAPALRDRAAAAPGYAPRRSGRFEVLMLASLRGYKGIEEFMALAAAFQARDDIRFVLVLNAEPAEVAAFGARHPQAGNVALHPRSDDPAAFYATADLVLNLSRPDQWIETFGLTLAEAMIFGIPVIAPPVGGPAEIVTDGREGYLIDSRDAAALATALQRLADDPGLALAMSLAARQRAEAFTFENYAANLQRILAELPPPRTGGTPA